MKIIIEIDCEHDSFYHIFKDKKYFSSSRMSLEICRILSKINPIKLSDQISKKQNHLQPIYDRNNIIVGTLNVI